MLPLLTMGCGAPRGFLPPPSGDEWYIKSGATKMEINQALDACDAKYPDDRTKPLHVRNNILFEQYFCMEDKGYYPNDGRGAMKSCKNFTNPKLPICEARGAYR